MHVQVAGKQRSRSSLQKAMSYWTMMAVSSAFREWRQTCWVRLACSQSQHLSASPFIAYAAQPLVQSDASDSAVHCAVAA